MKRYSVLFSIGIIFALFGIAHAKFIEDSWEYRAKISGGPNTKDFVILQLPSEFFSYLKSDLSDLRVVNNGGEVPYVAGIERESEFSASVPARIFNLSYIKGETTSFMVDIGSSGVFHNALIIDTSSENFRRSVEIQGSDDQSTWRTLTNRGQIFNYTVRDIKSVFAGDTVISYPDSTFRYLRVTISDLGAEPLKITGVRTYRDVRATAREVSYSLSPSTTQNEKERSTDVILDLGASGIPHRRGQLSSSGLNFSRAVAIYDSDDKSNWRLLTHAYIFRIDTSQFHGENVSFSYPESNRRYLKLSVLNYDDRPIEVGNVTLYGVVRRILFQYDPSETYYVYLGNPRAARAQYDIEKISQYVETTSLNRVESSPIEKNPSFKPVEPIKPPLTERSPYLLPLVLGAIIAILAFLLLRLIVNPAPFRGVSNPREKDL